jgi:hypothetical protein
VRWWVFLASPVLWGTAGWLIWQLCRPAPPVVDLDVIPHQRTRFVPDPVDEAQRIVEAAAWHLEWEDR